MIHALRWGFIGAGVLLLAASAFQAAGTMAHCSATSCLSVATILIALAVLVLIAGVLVHVRKLRRDTMTIAIAEGDERDAEALGKIATSVSHHENAERKFSRRPEPKAQEEGFIDLPKDLLRLAARRPAKPIAKAKTPAARRKKK